MTDYETRRTDVPPVLAVEDGRLVIKLIDGPLTLIAEVGDGRYFFSQVVAKLVDPALVALAELNVLERKIDGEYQRKLDEDTSRIYDFLDYASPND